MSNRKLKSSYTFFFLPAMLAGCLSVLHHPTTNYFFLLSSGRRCKAATNCHKNPNIMPPKSLDGDSARAPKVSRAIDGKGPFIDRWPHTV